jgi:hypothetical protein
MSTGKFEAFDWRLFRENYPKGDLHRVYVGAIESSWKRDEDR